MDIFNKWTHETDPANLQPKISAFNRRLAEFLRDHPPADVEQARFEKYLDAIEGPCSKREENLLREVFDADYRSHAAKASRIIEAVDQIGLEPFHPPDPLPPIGLDDVHLICWLAIEVAVTFAAARSPQI